MKLLGWDTSSKTGAIVALEWPDSDIAASIHGWDAVRLVGEWSLSVDSQHSERLLWGIHQVLESARWKLSDVDLFSVGMGPGSFTGIRIGVTTARTLAHSARKPLIGVSSLAALARPAALWLKAAGHSRSLVIAATDAAKGELFSLWGRAGLVASCAVAPEGSQLGLSCGSQPEGAGVAMRSLSCGSQPEGAGVAMRSLSCGSRPEGAGVAMRSLWKKGVREEVLPPGELMRSALARLGRGAGGAVRGISWIAVGEGRHRYPEQWDALPGKRRFDRACTAGLFPDQVQGRYLGMLSWEAWRAGLGLEALAVYPRYLRASDAEVKLKAGLLKPAPLTMPGALGTRA